MKKLAILCVSMVLFVSLGFTFLHAEEPEGKTIDIEVTSIFDEVNRPTNTVSDVAYGSKLTLDGALGSEENYEFVHWVVNGKLRADLSIDHEFTVTNNMKIDAVFSPTDKNAVLFMDTNEGLLDTQHVVDDGTADDSEIDLPDKPGYEVAGDPWSGSLTNITEHTVLILQYVKTADDVTLEVVNGTGDGVFEYNETVTVEADAGDFSYWRIGNNIVSYQEEYTFTVLTDTTITAVFDEGAPEEGPYVSLSYPMNLPDRDGYNSFKGQFYLPEDYELIEYGLLYSADQPITEFPADNFPYVGDGIHQYQASKFVGTTGEYLVSLDEEQSNYTRAYVVVKDEHGNLETIYDQPHNKDAKDVNSLWMSDPDDEDPVTTFGVVAATTDRGYLLQDPSSGKMISVFHSESGFEKGDYIVIEGEFSVSFDIRRIIDITTSELLEQNKAINLKTDHAVEMPWDDYDRASLQGELVELRFPWARILGTGGTSYARLAHTEDKVDAQAYTGAYIGLQNGANNPNITGTLSDIFSEGSSIALYDELILYAFLYDSTASYQKYVIIDDAHVVDDAQMTEADVEDRIECIIAPPSTTDENLDLITSYTLGGYNLDIEWTSDADVIENDGTVHRPAIGEDDETVTMTAKITNNGIDITLHFDVTVLAEEDVELPSTPITETFAGISNFSYSSSGTIEGDSGIEWTYVDMQKGSDGSGDFVQIRATQPSRLEATFEGGLDQIDIDAMAFGAGRSFQIIINEGEADEVILTMSGIGTDMVSESFDNLGFEGEFTITITNPSNPVKIYAINLLNDNGE